MLLILVFMRYIFFKSIVYSIQAALLKPMAEVLCVHSFVFFCIYLDLVHLVAWLAAVLTQLFDLNFGLCCKALRLKRSHLHVVFVFTKNGQGMAKARSFGFLRYFLVRNLGGVKL